MVHKYEKVLVIRKLAKIYFESYVTIMLVYILYVIIISKWGNGKTCRRRVFEFLNSYSEAFTYMQLNLMKKYNNYHHEYEEKKN